MIGPELGIRHSSMGDTLRQQSAVDQGYLGRQEPSQGLAADPSSGRVVGPRL